MPSERVIMFYKQIKKTFDEIDPVKRPFVRNIVLVWLFCFLAIASVNLQLNSSIKGLLIISGLSVSILNVLFGFLISRIKYAYLYYSFIVTGGLGALSVLFIGAFEMIAWRNGSLSVFWILFAGSGLLLLYIYYISIDRQILKNYALYKKPTYIWKIEKDVYATTNKKYSFILNLVRIFVVPFAPALGIALSRNFQGEQEWLIIGFMMLLLALIISAGYIRFFALSLKLLRWSRVLGTNIEISK
jgi:hypothetical protein